MISKRQKKPTQKADSLTSTSGALSLPLAMSFWVGKIKAQDTTRLENELKACAKDVKYRTTLVYRENGTTLKGAILADATVYIMADGSVLIFTAAGI